jgi:hypothetical protein
MDGGLRRRVSVAQSQLKRPPRSKVKPTTALYGCPRFRRRRRRRDTWVSCTLLYRATSCAAFFEESRMKFATQPSSTGNSGIPGSMTDGRSPSLSFASGAAESYRMDPTKARTCDLLQLSVFHLGLLEHRNVRVGIFP